MQAQEGYMRRRLADYWFGRRTFSEALRIWGFCAGIVWHLCVLFLLVRYIGNAMGWAQIALLPGGGLTVFILLLGLLQALFIMPLSAKILSACAPNAMDKTRARIISSVYTLYALVSFAIAALVLVAVPIWWNR